MKKVILADKNSSHLPKNQRTNMMPNNEIPPVSAEKPMVNLLQNNRRMNKFIREYVEWLPFALKDNNECMIGYLVEGQIGNATFLQVYKTGYADHSVAVSLISEIVRTSFSSLHKAVEKLKNPKVQVEIDDLLVIFNSVHLVDCISQSLGNKYGKELNHLDISNEIYQQLIPCCPRLREIGKKILNDAGISDDYTKVGQWSYSHLHNRLTEDKITALTAIGRTLIHLQGND